MTDYALSLDSGQARIAPSGEPPILQHDTARSHTPVPASEEPVEPLGDHQAYIVGLEASRAGIDLDAVVYDAIGSWPGTTREISEAIAGAALGWCVDQWRRDREEGDT